LTKADNIEEEHTTPVEGAVDHASHASLKTRSRDDESEDDYDDDTKPAKKRHIRSHEQVQALFAPGPEATAQVQVPRPEINQSEREAFQELIKREFKDAFGCKDFQNGEFGPEEFGEIFARSFDGVGLFENGFGDDAGFEDDDDDEESSEEEKCEDSKESEGSEESEAE